ncbi:Irs4p [Sugiyamaella lignohabitans]|uniref:Irs4p n=1 Tax=Sugiyamaella lignohabitans TaxID=796027 RepID=A0A167F4T9_9ASCO|nr:Irs4p [Sugiyamaella lignohabitans]ANB14831.1 Irs4p [Sugiyamaella lignohabitans]
MPPAAESQTKYNGSSQEHQLAKYQAAINAAAASSVAATLAAGSASGPKFKQTGPNKSLRQRIKEQQKASHALVKSERDAVVNNKNSFISAAASAASASASAAAAAAKKNVDTAQASPKATSSNSRHSAPSSKTTSSNLRGTGGSSDINNKDSTAIEQVLAATSAPSTTANAVNTSTDSLNSQMNGSAKAALFAFNKTRQDPEDQNASTEASTAAAAATANSLMVLPAIEPTNSRQSTTSVSIADTDSLYNIADNTDNINTGSKHTNDETKPGTNSRISFRDRILSGFPSFNLTENEKHHTSSNTAVLDPTATANVAAAAAEAAAEEAHILPHSSIKGHGTNEPNKHHSAPNSGEINSHEDSHSTTIPSSAQTGFSLTRAAKEAAKKAGATNKPLSVTALPPSSDAGSIASTTPPPLPAGTTAGSALAAAMAARTTVVDMFEKIDNDVNTKQQRHTRKRKRLYQPAARWTRSTLPTATTMATTTTTTTSADTTHRAAKEYVAPAPQRPSASILAAANWMDNMKSDMSGSERSQSPDRGRKMTQSPVVSTRTSTSLSRPRTFHEEMSLSETLLLPYAWEKEYRNHSSDSIGTGKATRNSSSPTGSPVLPSPREPPRRTLSRSPNTYSGASTATVGSNGPIHPDYFSYKNFTPSSGGSSGSGYTVNSSTADSQGPHATRVSHSLGEGSNSNVSLSSTLRVPTLPRPATHTAGTLGLAPSKSPNTSGGSFFSRFSRKARPERPAPAPPTTNLKITMRKEHKHRNFNEDKPWKHHMDAVTLTDREKKRYEGIWATNKGVHLKYLYEPDESDEEEDDDEAEVKKENSDPESGIDHRASLDLDERNPAEDIHGIMVRDIWRRSRLPDSLLEQIWDLVDRHHDGTLDREGFLVGMWLVDQCLYGRKLPNTISDKIWSSVGRLNVKIRLHKKEIKKEDKKERKKKKKGE